MRAGPGASFGAPIQVAELASIHVEGSTLSKDGTELIYNDATTQLERATYADSAGFTVVGPITELDVMKQDGYASLSPNGLTIYFESERSGLSLDIFTATRTAVGQPFGNVTPLSALDTDTVDEGDPEISADDLTLLYDTNSSQGLGSYDIYMVTRSRM